MTTERSVAPLIVAVVAVIGIISVVALILSGRGNESSEAGDSAAETNDADDGDDVVVFQDGADTSNPLNSPAGSVPEGSVHDIEFTYLDGSAGSLADFAGKPVVINFFATWCAPCRAEMPDFEMVSHELRDEVAFLGFNFQQVAEDAATMVDETGVTYPVGLDTDGSVYDALGGGLGMPTTAFVDAEGNVTRTWTGPLTADRLKDIIGEDFG